LSFSSGLPSKLAAEFLGTFVFVTVGAGSALGAASLTNPDSGAQLLISAFGNAFGLTMAVSATMGVSGGVLNPAVTLGLWVGKKLPSRHVLPYIVAQLVGATLAGIVLVLSFPSALGNLVHWGAPTLSGFLSVWQGTAVEALLTFILVIAVYGTAVDSRAPRIGGLGIGFAVLADILVGGNLTGAAMNPARAFGPMVAGGFYPSYWYIYAVGPVLGALIAGLAYRLAIESGITGRVGDK
jgi:MIP family channel proteins